MNRYKNSDVLQKQALKVLVGGVNSPVRSFKSVGGQSIFIKSAKGSTIIDADGNKYIDYVGAYGPMILGHADDDVTRELTKTLKDGYAFGANSQSETTLAELILEAYPGCDKIRFVNSGTEAVMSAIRLARGVTNRSKIIKFVGCYHGHMDDLLVAGGSGVATLSLPDSAGVTSASAQNTIVVPYNDIDALAQAFQKHKNEIAAIIVEPVAGNMGLVLPLENFLSSLKELCVTNNTLLISDEIMCGFRKDFKSVMSLFGVEADITCLGKIIGGGLPVGAYLAKNEIMDQLAPLGPVYQAGTLSGNPVVMSAGIATLKKIKADGFYQSLNTKTTRLCQELRTKDMIVNQFGSMFSIFFTNAQPTNFADVQKTNTNRFVKFFHKIWDKGLFVPPSPFETWFVSAAHSEADIIKTAEIIKESI